jgi:FtsP/CotA-like multicopper oxidase with cupredoxin domain
MLLQPIDYFLVCWFLLALLSTLYVGIDQFRNNPEPVVMKWGFILVTLYMGPLGLLLYVLADKEPRPGEHEAFTKPLWKQGIGSTIHCVAGDATGIILAAAITATLGLAMWIDVIVEYLAGFAFGLFIFQSLFMKSMMGGTYLENVQKSFVPEFISMNFMMAGMAPVMSFLMMGRDMRAMVPTELLFWGVMSLGVIAGFIFAYPSNLWMVARQLKHGLMTERKPAEKPVAMLGGAAVPGDQQPQFEFSMRSQGEDDSHNHGRHHDNDQRRAPEHGHHDMKSDATLPQLVALGGVSLLALAIGMLAPANWINMRLSAHDVGGMIMPPGMIMDRDTSADAMRDMAAADPRRVVASYSLGVRGDNVLPYRMEGGVKVFELRTSMIRWTLLPGVTVDAYAYNNQIPGPRIRIRQRDHVRINVTNNLPEDTTVHWHGLIVPNQMDGAAEVTQPAIPPNVTFSYEFTAEQHGTYFYHPHANPDRTQTLGLYGALIIDPANPADEVPADHEYVIQIQEWLVREGLTFPAMPMEGAHPNYFTINGKAYPATDTIHMALGETLKFRFIGTNSGFIHPMHIHGGPFEVVARDGQTIPPSARFLADTVNVGPGERYDVIWTARRPGKWLIHCHIPHHTTNNNTEMHGGGGLMMIIDVPGTISKPQP